MGWGLLALGLVLVVEGLLWALAPGLIEQALRLLRDLPENARRQAGLTGAALGMVLIWVAFRLGL